MALTNREIAVFLAFARQPGVGFKVLRALKGVTGVYSLWEKEGLHALLKHASSSSSSVGVMEFMDVGYEALEALTAKGIKLCAVSEQGYPEAFNSLSADMQPLWFFYQGDLRLASTPAVAVVGTRSPNETGLFLTRYVISILKELDLPVVSGLAKGIDEAAHEWAIMLDLPNVSVLANGLLKTYPAKNADLAKKIVAGGGLLISEFLPDSDPTRDAFVWRNRLQAALGRFLIAPQWARSSGTAHTVNFAKRMGKRTISLQLAGGPVDPARGVSELLFTLPRQQSQLVELLSSEITSVVEPVTQSGFSF